MKNEILLKVGTKKSLGGERIKVGLPRICGEKLRMEWLGMGFSEIMIRDSMSVGLVKILTNGHS